MGYETKCHTRVTDASGVREVDATVLLETDDLIVRGEARVKIPRRAIQDVKTRGDKLTVISPQAASSRRSQPPQSPASSAASSGQP